MSMEVETIISGNDVMREGEEGEINPHSLTLTALALTLPSSSPTSLPWLVRGGWCGWLLQERPRCGSNFMTF